MTTATGGNEGDKMTGTTSAAHLVTSDRRAAEVPCAGPGGQHPLSRLRGFHPGWFGAVMGTAIVGVVAFSNPGGASALGSTLRGAGQVLVVLAAALALAALEGQHLHE